jgi:PKD repeat protein
MPDKLTKLLTTLGILICLPYMLYSQCALITDNYSGQSPNSVCAPVNLTMDVRYKFIIPVDPSKVEILYVWNDGTGATTQVPAVSQGDTIFYTTQNHLYLPADNCSYTAEAFVVYDGDVCTSSSRQEQTFSAWARDNENGGVIITEPVVAQFCEGEDIVNVTFDDNSTFNCNVSIEPDKPNRLTRWVQFIYGTTSIGGDRIPDVTITDPYGNTIPMTDSDGNWIMTVPGPIIEIPIPADGPNQTSWSISAPAGGVAGDIFEITMRNWNMCNPYDRNPFDGTPPSDLTDGDYEPITTTALIEIITTPPVISNPSLEFCVESNINLTLSTSGGSVNWYTDSLMTNHIHTGNSFDPTGSPTYIDNSIGGKYSFYVTESIGACESAPSKITFEIFDTPIPPSDAGPDISICADTITLFGSVPIIGNGQWTTTGGALIVNPSSPVTFVSNLDPGPNLFRWTLTNGPCMSVDEVIVSTDKQPAPASAGPDQSFCDNSSANLWGNNPTNNGTGTWTIVTGGADFSDIHDSHPSLSNISGGENTLVWTIESQFGACLTTTDTMRILRDVTPESANAGADLQICDLASIQLAGNEPTDGGSGTWTVLSGGSVISGPSDYNATVSDLAYGNNSFQWEISSRFGICSGSTDQVTITRDEAPAPAFAGLDQFLCNSTSSPLGANSPTAGSGQWTVVTKPVAADPVFIPSVTSPGASVQILPGNEGMYEFAWTITNASCVTSDTIRVDFGKPVPAANAGADDTVCGQSAILNGNDPGIGIGTWSKTEGPGNIIFLPDSNSPAALARINPGDEGLYRIEWKLESGSCPPEYDTVNILFKPRPGVPLASDAANCGPGSVILTSAIGSNGTENRWYDASTGGSVLAASTSFTTPVLGASQSFWVATYDDVTQCESPRRKVDVSIHPIPENPVVSDVSGCGPSTFDLIASIGYNGNTNRWYDSRTGGGLLSTSKDYHTGLLNASKTFWVASYNDSTGCEGERVSVDAIVHVMPDEPLVSDGQRCGDGVLSLNASPGNNSTRTRWYDQGTGGNMIDTGLILITPFLTATKSYWITSYNDSTGCESSRKEVQAIINPVPAFPVTNNQQHCGPDTIVMSALPGANGTISRWYDSITGGTLLGEVNAFETGYLSGTKKYYVSSYNDVTHCESSRIEVQAIILPTPAANPIQGVGQVGQGQTNVIYSVNYNPGSSYTWDIPPGINLLLDNQNFVILEFPNLGIYNISVFETNSIGCPGPETYKTIQVREDLLYINLNVTSGNVCIDENLQISAIPAGGTPSYSFEWTGDTQFLSATNISNPVFNADIQGSYRLYVKVTDINLNMISDSIDLVVHPNPFVQINVPDTVVCAGNDLQINTLVAGGSGVYQTFSWTGQTMPLSKNDVQNPVFSSVIKGFYRLNFMVEDNNGCKAADSITIFNDIPRSYFTTDATPHCSPVTFDFFNASEDGVSYLWYFGDGDSSMAAEPSHQFINLTSSIQYYNVRLITRSVNGCEHTANEYVTVYPNPKSEIIVNPRMACHPARIILSATPGGYSYEWDYGDGTNETGGYNTIHTFLNESEKDTSYAIRLISTSFFNCLDTTTEQVIVHPSPEASFIAAPLSQMYPERTVYLNNTTEDRNWNYQWYFGDKTISYEKDPVSHHFPVPDEYIISLVVKGEHCSDSIWTQIEILPHPPVAQFQPVQPGCVPLTIQFENTSSYSTSFLWEFGDGAISNKPNPEYTYYEPGTYKIKLTAAGDGGTDTYSTINDAYLLPTSFFDLAPRYVYVNDEEVHFFNLSDNGDIFEWDFGDGTTSDLFNPTHMYTEEGTYDITLSVWTRNNCFDLYEMENAVLVQPSGKLIFPNAFRPESPIAENRVFKPGVMDQVDEYHLMIFNRWGELIFESFDRGIGWDGYVNGKMAKQDVYVWKAEGQYTSGQGFTEVGDVTLLH